MTSIQTSIYGRLAEYLPLTVLLGNSTIDDLKPAIYEEWAPPETPMPYINLRYRFSEDNVHWAKRAANLYVDIFTEKDSVLTEKIRNEVLNCLDRIKLYADNNVQIRIYSMRDGSAYEPDQNIVHWSMEFICFYWRKEFISHLNAE